MSFQERLEKLEKAVNSLNELSLENAIKKHEEIQEEAKELEEFLEAAENKIFDEQPH